MKNIILFGLFCSIQMFSIVSRADCENEIGRYQVGFPQGTRDSISFPLNNGYDRMTISDWQSDLNDPAIKAMYDLLYEAGYARGIVSFGVTWDVCQHLDEYALPNNMGGSWTTLPLSKVMGLKRISR